MKKIGCIGHDGDCCKNRDVLMAENGNMKVLLHDLLPELEARIKGLEQSYFGGQNEISECLADNKDMARRAREFLRGFEVPNAEITGAARLRKARDRGA